MPDRKDEINSSIYDAVKSKADWVINGAMLYGLSTLTHSTQQAVNQIGIEYTGNDESFKL